MLNFTDKIKLESHDAIVECNVIDSTGNKLQIKIKLDKKNAEQLFKNFESDKQFNIEDLGQIIEVKPII